ncbi:histidine phosphatase family protein [Actinokineospora bangkokensis]|uniref:Histidine phosphatase family protein n=1 Tax=Actinokineospora bangkokensis TaxID=1193682 RepID=A0A1Q9LH63_9PSEU|nr:histidine phosphatase family protein [Actinokineospora bangkokensis]OLR91344.1 histidine phosphatase family protein [Actinokineospora bangkokensis]
MSSTVHRQARYAAPTGATELVLVRHGESAPAVAGEVFDLVEGQGDPDLAPEGRAQAERVGARLRGTDLAAVYVTTLRRTAQTAAPLLAGAAPVVERDFREVHLGEWEGGAFRAKVAEGDPVAQRMFAEQRWDVIPGAESADSLTSRLRAAVRRVALAHPGGRVAVFTHGGVIAHLLHLATGSEPFAFLPVDNASISRLVVHGNSWKLRAFNDTAHLTG